ncbi:hypothetical protein ABZ714_19445 [Streptomyces sp. NPDC006798]|uniref:hypothetical protein n=1 Tax=Streptomyces sp. NPDC006798 TaxID=3155462 RepID=UPI0034032A8A
MQIPPVRVTELYYLGQWVPVSYLARGTVTIARGFGSEAGGSSRPDPTNGTLILDNRGGDLAPLDPEGVLYGLIGRNTPLRYSVEAGSPWLYLPGSTASGGDRITTPAAAALSVTGDLDVRVEAAATDWARPQMLAVRIATAGTNRCWALELGTAGRLVLIWHPDGTTLRRVATATAPVPAHRGQRITVRATLDADNGAAGCTVRFWWSRGIAGPWEPVGDPVVLAGTTAVHHGTAAPLEVGHGSQFNALPDGSALGAFTGAVYRVQLRAGIDGPLRADLDLAAGQTGATTITDTTGLLWTLQRGAYFTRRHVRLVGEIPAWPQEHDASGADAIVPIAPTGITRRLAAGAKPLGSAIARFFAAPREALIACWPLTDGDRALAGAPLAGTSPARAVIASGTGVPGWSGGTLADWIEPVLQAPSQTVGYVTAPVPFDGAARVEGWCAEWVRSGASRDETLVVEDRGYGTDVDPRYDLRVQISADGTVRITRVITTTDTSSTALVATGESLVPFTPGPHHIRLTTIPAGATTGVQVHIDGTLVLSATVGEGIREARALMLAWDTNPVGPDGGGTPALGYLSYWSRLGAPSPAQIYATLAGYAGETAGARVVRTAQEKGIPVSASGVIAEQTRLGPQYQETLLDALAEAGDADHGLVLEQRDALALVYRGRDTLYNQTPALVLDYATGVISPPFRPAPDDKASENDVTVVRKGGSPGRAVLTEGPLSIQDPPAGVGLYDVSHTLNLYDDGQPAQHAGWMLHLGTHPGTRYAKITLNLGNPRVAALVDQILRADVGDVLRILNPPRSHGPGPVDLLIRGYTETCGPDGWTIVFTCAPGGPWTVAVLDDPIGGRADTSGSLTLAAVSSSATALEVATTTGPLWTTDPADWPFDVAVGGEVMRVTAVAPRLADTFGRTVTGGWGAPPDGQPWQVYGGGAADFSVSGGLGRITHAATNTPRMAVIPVPSVGIYVSVDVSATVGAPLATGASTYIALLCRATGVDTYYSARLELTTTGAVLLSLRKMIDTETELAGVTVPGLTHSAAVRIAVRLQITGTVLRARAWAATGTEPTIWHVAAEDFSLTGSSPVGIRTLLGTGATGLPVTVTVDDLVERRHQRLTVTRSVNGITKPHLAQAAVRLANPSILAL